MSLLTKLATACFLLSGADARRVTVNEDAKVDAKVEFGATISSRFEMHHVLWRQSLENRAIKHIPLPSVVTKDFGGQKELFAGSFGEAWAATDRHTGKKVVVKMFYTTNGDNREHITWAAAGKNPALGGQLQDAAGECEVAKDMQKYAKSDPTGASRLMQCYEDHVTRGTSLTGHTVTDHMELFQVLEDCGGLPLSKWLESQEPTMAVDPEGHVARSLKLFKQLMEGLNYLTANSVKWVHHDLKPDNAVVKELPDGQQVLKIIDFGAVTKVSPSNAAQPIVSTVPFAPPEWFPVAKGFNWQYPSSFDTYQAGTMLYEMMTGYMFYEKIAVRSMPPTMVAVHACKQRMLGYMAMYAAPEQQAQAEQACVETLGFESVKGSNGAEYDITGHWGKATTRLVKTGRQIQTNVGASVIINGRLTQQVQVVDETRKETISWEHNSYEKSTMQQIFFSTAKDAYVGAANVFLGTLDAYGWHNTFMKTVAFDPSARATPAEVLSTQLMQETASVADPDYSADEAAGGVTSPSAPSRKPITGVKHGGGMRGSVEPLHEQPVANSDAYVCPDYIHRHYLRGRPYKVLVCVKQPNGNIRVINA